MAVLLHLGVLGALLVLPGQTPNEDARPESAVALVLQPPAADAVPAAPPQDAQPAAPSPPTPSPPMPAQATPAQATPAQTTPDSAAPEPPAQPEPVPETPTLAKPPEAEPSQPEVASSPPPIQQTAPEPPPPAAEAIPAPEMPLPPPPPPSRPVPKTAPIRPRSAAAAPPASKPAAASSPPATAESRPSESVAALPSADVLGPYRNSLANHLRPYQRYPTLARTRREQGLVVVHVTVQRDGQIAAMSIERGSGVEALDREALATLKRAEPLPPVPASIPGSTLELVFPLRFQLD